MIDDNGEVVTPASAECRTSDITLAEFKTLRGKMDAFDPRAKTVEEFVGGTPDFRTDLYAGPTSGQSIEHKLNKNQQKLSDEIVETLTNFAWRGNPNGIGAGPWPLYRGKSNALGILNLNVPFSSEISDASLRTQHNCDLWDSVLTYSATATK